MTTMELTGADLTVVMETVTVSEIQLARQLSDEEVIILPTQVSLTPGSYLETVQVLS